jgi:OmpA family/PEGA domain
MSPRPHIRFAVLILPLFLFVSFPALAQNNIEMGKLKIHVSPKQAYVFVDGKAIRDGSQTIDLSAGTHRVGVENYGYEPKIQEVHIGAGETTHLAVSLQSFGDEVSGPFGDIELKGHPRAAVLLDGKTPAYFVGHVDEFDWNWIWHQRLLVHPGTYQLTATREGRTIWSGPVAVKAGEQVTVYLDQNGRTKTKNWSEGNTMGPQPRFHAGIASATVPVAPVSADLTARNTSLTCGQSTDLTWSAQNAVDTSITDLGEVPSSGDRSLRPPHTMNYELTAKGPGGEVTKTVAVNVENQPTVTISLSNVEVHYHKIGDKVVEDGPTTLQWNASNADKVTIAPLGSESMAGSTVITPKPTEMSLGPVNDTIGYTIQASNSCGGTATKTAMLHIVGSIDPAPSIRLASLFYPTDYPTPHHPKVGLVRSEKQTLAKIAQNFQNYRQYDDKATLLIVGHADVRLSQKYNLALGDRRDTLVKSYLVSQGIPASEIETHSVGKDQQMLLKQVEQLQSQDPQKPEKRFVRSIKDTWLAYNRRVDVILEPSGQKPVVAYPNDASDATLLWEPAQPSLKKVESAAKWSGASGTLHAGLTQN